MSWWPCRNAWRPHTEEKLDGLEVIHERRSHIGPLTSRADLRAVLDRAPEIALVDELHMPTCRLANHAKRWQDIEELLEEPAST